MTEPVSEASSQPTDDIEQAALRLLAVREHSKAELARKLESRDFPSDEISALLKRFEAAGYLDDQRYTELYLEMRARKGFGPCKIRQELLERGIANDIISDWVDDRDPRWRKQMAEVALQKFGVLTERTQKELGRRARFLEYRGFPTYLIGDFLFS
jgi:regulatory protein